MSVREGNFETQTDWSVKATNLEIAMDTEISAIACTRTAPATTPTETVTELTERILLISLNRNQRLRLSSVGTSYRRRSEIPPPRAPAGTAAAATEAVSAFDC